MTLDDLKALPLATPPATSGGKSFTLDQLKALPPAGVADTPDPAEQSFPAKVVDNYVNPKGYGDDLNKISSIGQNTMKRIDNLNNIQAESAPEYAARMKAEKVFGLPTSVNPEDLNGGIFPSWLALGKGAANVPVSAVNLAKNVGSFAWNSIFHPVDTASNILSDPVGFAEGMISEPLKDLFSGLLVSPINDVMGGNSEKVAGDMQAGIQKAWTSFLDDPVGSIIQAKFMKDFATNPKGTASQVANDTVDLMKKPAQVIKDTAVKGPEATLKPITDGISNIWNGLKTTQSLFTKAGRSKVAATQAGELYSAAKATFDIQNYQEKLQALDINSPQRDLLQSKLDQAKADLEQSNSNLGAMAYKLLNFTKGVFDKNNYQTASDFSNELGGSLDTKQTEKDGRYQQALTKPDGTPIPITDVSSLTDALRAKADVLGKKGQGRGAVDATKNFADALDLRQQIHEAGGVQQYIDREVQSRISGDKTFGNAAPRGDALAVVQNKIRNDVIQELSQKVSKSGQPTEFFSSPLSAHDLQQSMSAFFDRSVPDSDKSLDFFLNSDKYGPTVKGSAEEVMKTNLERDNPAGYTYKTQADAKNVELNKIASTFKDKQGNVRTFDTNQDMIDFATSHWGDLQKMPELVLPMQNTIASKILSDAVDPVNGEVNYTKLESGIKKYGDYLTPQQLQILKEHTLLPKLNNMVISDEGVSNGIKEMIGMNTKVNDTTEQIGNLEDQIKLTADQQKVVGIDPESIVRNIEGLKSEADLKSFIQSSGITDVKSLGKLYQQSVFERNNGVGGKDMTPESLVKTFDDLISFGKGSKTYAQGLKNSFFDKADQQKFITLRDTAEAVKDLYSSIPSSQSGSNRLLNGVSAAIFTSMGWHLAGIRAAFQALKVNKPGTPDNSLTEDRVREILMEKVPQSQRSWFTKAIMPALGAQEAKRNPEERAAYMKSAEDIMGRPLSADERTQVMQQYDSANQ